jgi:hypothetical protein
MCPVCIATAALIAGKAASTGGLAALGVKTWHKRQAVKFVTQPSGRDEKVRHVSAADISCNPLNTEPRVKRADHN